MRKLLSDWNAPYIQALKRQIEGQSKTTLANWALDFAERELLPVWIRRVVPEDPRPQLSLALARDWLAGRVKLGPAKTAILACHAAARENAADPAAQAAARAIGQCAASIHSPRHSIGLALYGALALAYDELGADAPWVLLEPRAAGHCSRMLEALRAVSVDGETNPAAIRWPC
ncbi:MAG: hypothetical protein PHX81_03025 [Eubacteriales bacterium]|nr:hypothetical protein [Clostridiales bacterium]MDD2442390.1 hypothetical protein [Eubacteriales bacterium]MDD4139170.1 hypothetical protein [Eubacteriales bacterium]